MTPLAALGVMLGSFDPLHLAHEHMAGHLLRRFGALALLVPAQHFHKTICPPRNATLRQRLELLEGFRRRRGGRIYIGLAREVLFIELAEELARRFPGTAIWFGVGQGTFRALLGSERYYRQTGRAWGDRERELLRRLRRRTVVFARPGRPEVSGASSVVLPRYLQLVSSTRVRAGELEGLVAPEVARRIRALGLYRSRSTSCSSDRG